MSDSMLFRPADEPNEAVWGLKAEWCVFDDEDVADQLQNGWFAHPHDVPGCSPEDQPVKRGPGRPRKVEGDA